MMLMRKSHGIDIELCLWGLRITITLTESALLIFFAIRSRNITDKAGD